MTKLIFLGSGSAFTLANNNFQSNLLLVSESGKKLLIDCGTDIRFSLHAAGFSYRDITDIYISHLHADHAGGLEYIGFSTKFDPRCSRPNIYLNKEICDDLWNHTLSGGMKYIQGEVANLDTYFKAHPINCGGSFTWENIKFNLVQVIHVNNDDSAMPSYGLFFEIHGTKIFLTTDTQLCLDKIAKYYEQADIILQDCETSRYPSQVHAHYQQLLTLPDEIKRKMWLYHYQQIIELPNAKEDGFIGFVQRGQVFEFVLNSILV
jgi:ribonuclease BN (tRNA processing enzyme)